MAITLVERDQTAALPKPLHGEEWAARTLRELFDSSGNTRDAAMFREVTDLGTAARRAVQSAEALRRTANGHRALDANWLDSVAAAHQRRAQTAADEFEYTAGVGRDLGGSARLSEMIFWAALMSANAWAAAHLSDAAAIVRDPDGDPADARAWMRTAADRLDTLRPIAR
jgi:hypothetical protein